MQSASREASDALRTEVESVLARFSSTESIASLAEELYSVAEVLTAEPRLRRRLADPALPPQARAELAERLLQGKISASAMSVVKSGVSQRWSTAWNLVDGFAASGDDVLLAAADNAGSIDELEDELFRFERILESESNLTTLLDDASVEPTRRADLLASVLADKVNPLTAALVRHSVTSQRKRSILLAIDDLIEAAGARRQRSVARVVSAVELTNQQQTSLAARLTEMYGRRIEVRHAVDPSIRGGLIVHIGDEVIDGSIASRLSAVRSSFVG